MVLIATAPPASAAGGRKAPVVVELFTAQGCASCLKANALAAKIADRDGIVVLTWPVDYWDYLGWKDTFAAPEFAQRQRAFDDRFGLRDVYTPQVIVDGATQASGDKAAVVEGLIRAARRAPADPPQMKLAATRVAVGSGRRPKAGAEVWLVRYDPREQSVEVRDGDNRGKTVVQRNVVRQLLRLGRWKGAPAVYRLPVTDEEGLATLVLLQAAKGGEILGLAHRPAAGG